MKDHQYVKIASSVELNTCTQRVILQHVSGKDKLTPSSHKKQVLKLWAKPYGAWVCLTPTEVKGIAGAAMPLY